MQQQNEVETTEGRGAVCSAGGVGMLLGGMAAGAALMYLFDPERGRTRRARLSDQTASKLNRFGDAACAQTRHLRNRAQGLMHEAGELFRSRGQNEGDGRDETNQHVLGATPPNPAPVQGM
jgi:gas vesicle protein